MEYLDEKLELGFMTVGEFVTLNPYRDQFKDGKALVNKSRVNELLNAGIYKVLRNITSPVCLTVDDRIYQGNHRQAACIAAIEKGELIEDYKIPYIKDLTKSTLHEQTVKAIVGNVGGNRKNLDTQAVMGHHILSRRVYYPIYAALKKAGGTQSRLMALSMKLGGYLNNNPDLVRAIKRGALPNITGADLYTARRYPEANKTKFFDCTANVDLREYTDHIAALFTPGMNLINELKDSGIWKEKFGNKSTLEYIILGLSARGLISDNPKSKNKISTKKFINLIKKTGGRINRTLQKDFVFDTVAAEDTILGVLNVG